MVVMRQMLGLSPRTVQTPPPSLVCSFGGPRGAQAWRLCESALRTASGRVQALEAGTVTFKASVTTRLQTLQW